LPSNLRPTTREFVHLVMRCHFRSRDMNGDRTIRSAISENPMLHTHFMAACFIEPELLPMEVLHCGNNNIYLFCSRDLDLDSTTHIGLYELDPCFYITGHFVYTWRIVCRYIVYLVFCLNSVTTN